MRTELQIGVAAVQGVYYAVTAVWPLVSMRSFVAVTGPKSDYWLVRTVAVLIGAISVPLLMAAWRGHVPAEVAGLAVVAAAGLLVIDVYYVAARRIARVYLLDAAAEGLLILAWLAGWLAP